MQIPLGWWTDLEVARRSGGQVLVRGDAFVVRTPDNPDYYWGNFVLVPGDWAPDAARAFFAEQFPDASHVAIGLLGPVEAAAWSPWPLEANDVLSLGRPAEVEAVEGYTVRALRGDDWRQAWRNEVQGQPTEYADFAWRRIQSRQRLVERGDGLFVGAFLGDELAADLGIVLCGSVARYQSVFTHPDHRGRGLASWLLCRAGLWAGRHGAERWVILAEPDSAARRLYGRLGFASVETAYQVERVPGAD